MKPVANLGREQKKIVREAVAAAAVCSLLMVAGYFVMPRLFVFPNELPDQLAFALRADVAVFLKFGRAVAFQIQSLFHPRPPCRSAETVRRSHRKTPSGITIH